MMSKKTAAPTVKMINASSSNPPPPPISASADGLFRGESGSRSDDGTGPSVGGRVDGSSTISSAAVVVEISGILSVTDNVCSGFKLVVVEISGTLSVPDDVVSGFEYVVVAGGGGSGFVAGGKVSRVVVDGSLETAVVASGDEAVVIESVEVIENFGSMHTSSLVTCTSSSSSHVLSWFESRSCGNR